ncbi:MAG: glycosyltransferase family 4 protein, partial [Bacteroidetes bacterium]|nr:glycosyltransferase family 4 protein [Bacteroidota bacterium]
MTIDTIKRALKRMIKQYLPPKLANVLRNYFASKPPRTRYYRPISHQSYAQKNKTKIIVPASYILKYNGGTKLYNLLIKLLRDNEYDAYFASAEGGYDEWLVHQQPIITFEDVKKYRAEGADVRITTSWLDTPDFAKVLDGGKFYYFDLELKWTLKFRRKLDYYLKHNRIAGIATHSRYIQSWYMTNYNIRPILINVWSDKSVFYEDTNRRVEGRIGCMIDSPEDKAVYELLVRKGDKLGLCESVVNVLGDEKTIADTLRTVDIFVGLNQGKNPLWGEGCPLTQEEAMHSGCALVAFDSLGNREYLYHNWTGLLVKPGNDEGLWEAVEYLLKNKDDKERIRENGKRLVRALLSEEGKMELVSEFLDLKGTTYDELTAIFPRPFFLQNQEVPYLARYAAQARKRILELGCAFGGS